MPALRISAGYELWRRSGETDALVSAVREYLDTFGAQADAGRLRCLAELGDHAPRELVHLLRRQLTTLPARLAVNEQVVQVLWRLHGDPTEVLPWLRTIFAELGQPGRHAAGAPPLVAAVDTVVELGPPAATLMPALWAGLDDPVDLTRVACARALWQAGLLDPADAVPAVLREPDQVAQWPEVAVDAALDLVAAMRAETARPLLAAYLAGDRRLGAGTWPALVDERLCQRIATTITALS